MERKLSGWDFRETNGVRSRTRMTLLTTELVERLDAETETSVRRELCLALGDLGTDEARRTLEEHRLDVDPEVSAAAAEALDAVGQGEDG